MEAKKQGSGEEDLSMEDILQSIRRIIADEGEEAKTAAPKDDSPPAPSDVLELTDMIAEEPAPTGDVLGDIDAALAPEPAPTPAAEAMPIPDGDALLSKAAESEALAALDKLKIPEPPTASYATSPSPKFRSGNTVEDMVEDLLRPMMKEWLDDNLPKVVERIVEREVQRLTRR